MKTNLKLLLLFILFGYSVSYCYATDYWVRAQGLPGNSGTNYANAVDKVSTVINNFTLGQNDVIKVCNDQGPIEDNILWPQVNGITLTGWNWGAGSNNYEDMAVIRSYDNISSIIKIINTNAPNDPITNNTIIKFLMITKGTADEGGGIYMKGYVAPSLSHLVVTSNSSTNGSGGGIYYNPYFIDYSWDDGASCYAWTYGDPCILIDCNITYNQSSANGGGIYIEGIEQTLSTDHCPPIDWHDKVIRIGNSNVNYNTASGSGGGIYLTNAFMDLSNSTIDENEAGGDGGGMLCLNSKTTIDEVYVTNNTATLDGGGIHLGKGLLHDHDCHECPPFDNIEHDWTNVLLIYNWAGGNGGGLCIAPPALLAETTNDAYLDLKYTTGFMYNNYAENNGGGIYVEKEARMYLKDITIQYNHALSGNGGGIYNNCEYSEYNEYGNTLEHHFDQLAIVQNDAYNYGGGIFTKQTFYCINSTIADNNALTYSGGGAAVFSYLYNSSPQYVIPVFFNTILAHNHDYSGDNQIFNDDYACSPQFDYCDVAGWTDINHGFSGWYYWDYLFWDDCSFPSYAIDWPDPFVSSYGDYHLADGSHCVNGGSNWLDYFCGWPSFGSLTYPWSNDIEGQTRIIDDIIDIGAFEFLPPPKSSMLSQSNQPDNNKFKATIFPNPSSKDLDCHMLISVPETSSIVISIIDILGNVRYKKELTENQETILNLNYSDLGIPAGSYLIIINYITEKGVTGRLVKSFIKT